MNCTKWICCFGLFLLTFTSGFGQGFIFGPKIGPSIAVQQWNGFERQPALLSHLAVFIESYSETNTASSLFAQIGIHRRGSGERFTNFSIGNNNVFNRRFKYIFNNISLLAGAKRVISEDKEYKPYYTVGVRVDYTASTNLDQFVNDGQFQNFVGFFPIPTFVNKFNYGFTVGGGFQKEFSEHVGGAIEFSIHPDISKQYTQPRIPGVIDLFTGNPRTIAMQEVRNITLEISFILRLLRKVEYYD